jgi:hypothetical protein
MPHPNHHSNLNPEIERNQIDDKRKERFENIEKRKDNPVREPLSVVNGSAIHGLETHVRWVQESDEIDQELGTPNQGQHPSENRGKNDKKQGLRISRLCFELLESICNNSKEEVSHTALNGYSSFVPRKVVLDLGKKDSE